MGIGLWLKVSFEVELSITFSNSSNNSMLSAYVERGQKNCSFNMSEREEREVPRVDVMLRAPRPPMVYAVLSLRLDVQIIVGEFAYCIIGRALVSFSKRLPGPSTTVR